MNCIFCDIINKKVNAKIVYEDERVMAFEDISPVAPVHFLVIPKIHIESLLCVTSENSLEISSVFESISCIALKYNLEAGFRVVCNCGEAAGQTVNHLHFHVLGQRILGWPPG